MDNTRVWRVLSRKSRLLTAGVAVVLLAVPATAAAAATGSQASPAASATCPWVTSRAPVSQRVAQLMSQMTLAD